MPLFLLLGTGGFGAGYGMLNSVVTGIIASVMVIIRGVLDSL